MVHSFHVDEVLCVRPFFGEEGQLRRDRNDREHGVQLAACSLSNWSVRLQKIPQCGDCLLLSFRSNHGFLTAMKWINGPTRLERTGESHGRVETS